MHTISMSWGDIQTHDHKLHDLIQKFLAFFIKPCVYVLASGNNLDSGLSLITLPSPVDDYTLIQVFQTHKST